MNASQVPASAHYLGELLSHPRFHVRVWLTKSGTLLAMFGGWVIFADTYRELGEELAKW
jgi:hypothetical protein